ncbi:MAG: 23S rRNA (pseudouridine(1915)-N(3))-methyltransferase RlmH [Methanomicrobiales archaeon]|jgi:23S rRNA (pseudouridine1915-N3)-methyltransferase|nr:23S rRNA (pseudouridine(1915)-N(3))-methyltransferase RlmH [Methanomicrobiales archaeon]
MHIRILAAAPLKEDFLRAASGEYLTRLRPYVKVSMEEVSLARMPRHLARSAGAARVVALDARGSAWSSSDLAEFLKTAEVSSVGTVIFIIGDPDGLSSDLLHAAETTLSLSRLTFTHGMARVILLEQIYRAFRIIRGEPYHR